MNGTRVREWDSSWGRASAPALTGTLTAALTAPLTREISSDGDCRAARIGVPLAPMQLIATWLTGPDSGRRHEITIGSTIIGTAGLRCDDPDLLAHHALLEVHADRHWITQLSGSAPITVAGVPVTGRSPLAVGAPVRIAGSSLVLSHEPAAAPGSSAPATTPRRIVRAAREAAPDIDVHLAVVVGEHHGDGSTLLGDAEPAPERERPGGLVPTLVGLAGSTVLALATRRPMFIAFGAIGAAVACSSWLGQWIAFRRRHRRESAAHSARRAAAVAERVAHEARVTAALRGAAPGVAHALHLAHEPAAGLWARRSTHRDAFVVAAGLSSTHDDARPTVVDLAGRARVALCGPMAHAVARSVVVQLATQCGPADLRIAVATHDPHRWTWLAELPHLHGDSGPLIIAPEHLADAADTIATTGSHLVVITDEVESLGLRTSGLRRVVDDPAVTCALLAVLPHERDAPHVCTAVLSTHRTGTATWRPHPAVIAPSTTFVAGLGPATAAAVSAALAACTDPEDVIGAIGALPTAIELDELLPPPGQGVRPTARSVALHWATAPDRHDPALRAPLGVGPSGTVQVDLVRDGPHALVAGTTGSGKSELLRSLVVGLATECSPHHLSFVLVDYKGGATFDPLHRLPHVSGVVTDLDDHLAERMLRSLHAELRRREELLRTFGAADLTGYRGTAPHAADGRPPIPRLVVIIDEFAALAIERPSFLHALVGIAQRGRSLGVHLVLATQRPGGLVADDIRANTTLRIALRLHEAADALDVVGDRLPTTLPRTRPGRAVLRVGGDEPIVVQTARCSDLDRYIDRLVDAAAIAHLDTPPRPWLAPLPEVLHSDDVERDAIGVLDDPDHQRRIPLRHVPGDGPLLVVGSRGAGVTSTLLAIAQQRHAERPGDAIHVIDANGDQRWTTLHDHRLAQVTNADCDGLVRLVHHLSAHPAADATIIVDGIDELRTRLDVPAHDHRLEHRHDTRLEQLVAALAASIATGADVVLGAATPALVPTELLGRTARQWVMHLHDPQRAAIIGMPPSLVPGPVAGRVRVDTLLGQLAPPHARPAVARPVALPGWWLADQPSSVWAGCLGRPRRIDGATDIAIGVHAIDGSEVRVTIDDGEHLMVLGPRGSGRTSALTMLAATLHAATAPASATPAPPPIVIDDAERVDDPDGALVRAVDGGGASVFAAARGDALRHRLGHWTNGVRRSRLAIVLVGGTGDATADGELLGVALPRRFPVAVRPGAAWLVDGSTLVPLRMALVRTAPVAEQPAHPADLGAS